MIDAWNQLPVHIRPRETVRSFKTTQRTYFYSAD